jgi:hypothetical protein
MHDESQCSLNLAEFVESEMADKIAKPVGVDCRGLFGQNPRRAPANVDLGTEARCTG